MTGYLFKYSFAGEGYIWVEADNPGHGQQLAREKHDRIYRGRQTLVDFLSHSEAVDPDKPRQYTPITIDIEDFEI